MGVNGVAGAQDWEVWTRGDRENLQVEEGVLVVCWGEGK